MHSHYKESNTPKKVENDFGNIDMRFHSLFGSKYYGSHVVFSSQIMKIFFST